MDETWNDINLISKVIDELIEKEGWRGGWDNIKHLMKEGEHPEKGAQRLNNLLRKISALEIYSQYLRL